MKMKWSAAIAVLLAMSSVCRPQQPNARTGNKVSLCTLFAHSDDYLHKTVTVTVHAEAGKHVSVIWDPTCRDRLATLQFKQGSDWTDGIRAFVTELDRTGMTDHPVVVTLTGTWMGQMRTDNGFIAQPRIVFLAVDASNVSRSVQTEHLY